MTQPAYYTRNYTKGDEITEIEIYNSVITEMDSSLAYRNIEYIQYRYSSLNYKPEHTLYLVDKTTDDIVGYCAVDIYSEVAIVTYPFILNKYRTKELQEELFSEVFEYAKANNSIVETHSYAITLPLIHEFFDTVGYENKSEVMNLQVESKLLNQPVTEYTGHPTPPEELHKLQSFIESADSPNLPEIDLQGMQNEYKSRVYTPDRMVSIIHRDQVLAYSGMSVATYPKTGENYGYQSFMLFDTENPEIGNIGINRIFLFAKALRDERIPYFRMQILVDTPEERIKPYRDLGFVEYEPNAISYTFWLDKLAWTELYISVDCTPGLNL